MCHAPVTALVQVSGTSWPNSGALSSLHPSGRTEQADLLPFDPLSPWLPGPGILLVLSPLRPLCSLLLLPRLAPMHSSGPISQMELCQWEASWHFCICLRPKIHSLSHSLTTACSFPSYYFNLWLAPPYICLLSDSPFQPQIHDGDHVCVFRFYTVPSTVPAT